MLFAFIAKNNLLLSPFDKIKKPSPWGKVDAKRTDEGGSNYKRRVVSS